jgi:beta-glucanase (GH16 family)
MSIRMDWRFSGRSGYLLAIVVLLFLGSRPAHAQASCSGVSNNSQGAVTWVPHWCEEFNAATAGPPDTTVWSFDLGNSGFGNNEIETYCGPPGYSGNPSNCPTTFSTSTSNAYLDGSGHLVLQALDTPNSANSIPPPLFFNPRTQIWLPVTIAGFLVCVVVAPVAHRRNHSPLHAGTLVAGLTLLGAVTWNCGGGGSGSSPPPPSGSTWFSARMKTEGLENFQYGRIEASIQLPNTTNQGLWPAFWSLGSDIATVPWPGCGEVDFMEVWSSQVDSGPGPAGNRTTVHTASTGGDGLQPNGAFTFPSGQANDTAFHAYGTIWSANMMQFYIDNPLQPYYIATASNLASGDTWAFNANLFLLTNIAVGGTLGGTPSSATPNPGVMMLDYVRQYQPSATVPAPVMGTPNPPAISLAAGATTGNTSTVIPALTPATGYVYFSCSTNAPSASCTISTNDQLNPYVANSSANPAEALTVTVATTGTTPGSYTVTVYAFTESNSSNGANSNADASVVIPLTVS